MRQERGFIDELGRWIPDAQSGLSPFLTTTELIFRSQITPEMKVSLSDLESQGAQKDIGPGLTGKAVDWFLSNVVRPEMEIHVLGQKHTIAPWGRPEGSRSTLLTLGLIAALAGTGYAGYRFWKGKER